jgi:cyclopropane-fatty-acyl-phospholipid synthase
MNSVTSTLTAQPLPLGAKSLISLLEGITVGTLDLTTPDGTCMQIGDGSEPRANLQISDWSAMHRILRNGDIGLAEAYRDGLLHSDSLTKLLRLGIRNQSLLESAKNGRPLLRLGYRLRHLLRTNTRRGSRRNISAHYDLGNDFYGLWLDPSMTYSSARFQGNHNTDLATAQSNKYQHMIELTGASAGDRILEIGCGWGGFAEHAARQGIQVHGVTLSKEQLEFARSRIEQAGLSDLASFELRDYRDIQGQYDHIVSIEMLEAVGERYWGTYFDQLRSLLKIGGKAAIQVITIDDAHFESYRRRADFIQHYIFPGGMLPSAGKLRKIVQESRLTTIGMEQFGKDYAETLRRWKQAFERRLDEVRDMGFDRNFIQLWRFYLCFCEAGFEEGRIDVVHLQLEKR